ncbi:hypothetical protein [Propionimicrobium sp. PCR01-08-3]|uniref:hypothetical protein n=1 Tax=Propionimicrobium sp. PCR01-08-3 TaxID=3052086 RepID=UPI00255CA16E|nr:hypothetical protein [Propionimicrobium sp. PCR01-08-3]WIY81405.1 hypothetical protein QQ658_07545 [Propionimicrobium sp. PCR01-08-3]
MTEFVNMFMPGAKHWEDVKRAEKSLFVESKRAGSGPGDLDLDSGFMVLRDQTGMATETSTTIGNPYREVPEDAAEDEHKSAADTISQMPPAADSDTAD